MPSRCVCVYVLLVEENLCLLGVKPFGSGNTLVVLPLPLLDVISEK